MALKLRNAIAVAGLLAALSFCAPIADAGKGKKSKPDLVPTAGRLDGQPFSFIGERLRASVDVVIANRGDRRAGPTLTRVFLKRGKARFELADRAVDGLRPGESDQGTSEARGRNQYKPGRYVIVVCVDATDEEREENEKNNCGKLEAFEFYSTYREFEGTINGVAPGLSFDTSTTTETWKSSVPASFEFAGYRGNGLFEWKRTGGSVSYSHKGTFIGCRQSGAASFVLDPSSRIEVNYDQDRYIAYASVPTGATFPVTAICPTGSFPIGAGPLYPTTLNVPFPGLPLDFGSTRLRGAAADPVLRGVNYTWNLAGVER